ncbi:MAG: hypothetical protein JKX95_06380 [Bacteroidia bacterium]|nr:hypothetical protein [Bacteroidia bacterium]
MLIERVALEKSEARKITRMVSIEPDFDQIDIRKQPEVRYLKSDRKEKNLSRILIKNAKRSKIELTVIDANDLTPTELDYFNHLASLKMEVLQKSLHQNTPIDPNAGGAFNKNWLTPKKSYFNYPPIISPEYSKLAQKYKTPYFSFQGVYSFIKPVKGKLFMCCFFPPIGLASFFKPDITTYFYHVIVNVKSSQVVYRELRRINDSAKPDHISGIIYDSFKIFKSGK